MYYFYISQNWKKININAHISNRHSGLDLPLGRGLGAQQARVYQEKKFTNKIIIVIECILSDSFYKFNLRVLLSPISDWDLDCPKYELVVYLKIPYDAHSHRWSKNILLKEKFRNNLEENMLRGNKRKPCVCQRLFLGLFYKLINLALIS